MKSLVKKYRPKSIGEFCGNQQAFRGIYDSCINNKNGSAILISGEPGLGKTSIVKLCARRLLAVDEDFDLRRTVDYYELGSPHYRGIDAVEHVSKAVQFNGLLNGKSRVAFFDEAHTLTPTSQQYLPKVIEDAIDGVQFFFVTTDVSKISDAIISRCATYHLSLPSEEEVVVWLQKILSLEGSEASEEALSAIASKASYRPREALILLEKIIYADPDQHLCILKNAPTIPPSLRMGNNSEFCDDKRFNRSFKSGLLSTVAKFFTPRDTLQAIEKYVCSTGNLLDKVFPPKQIYVSPLIDESSLTMVYAEAGVGKSWFVLSLAMALTSRTGESFKIGSFEATNRCGVMIIDGEMTNRTIQTRIKKLVGLFGSEGEETPCEIVGSDEIFMNHAGRINLVDDKWRDGIYAYLTKNPNIKVLVLDNLSSLCPGISENTKSAWDPVNQWFLSLRTLGIAVIAVHHANKSGGYRGHSGRIDNLDSVVSLTRVGATYELCLKVEFDKARNAGPGDCSPFIMRAVQSPEDPEGLVWEYDIEGLDPSEQTADRDNLIMAHAMLHKISQAAIADQFGVSQSTVSNLKRKAKREGFLTEEGIISEEGEAFLRSVDLDSLGKDEHKKEGSGDDEGLSRV